MRLTMLAILGLAAITLSSGCCHCPNPLEAPPLPYVPDPVVPKVKAEALACLDQQTYQKLVERDVRKTAALHECQAILRSTHETQP